MRLTERPSDRVAFSDTRLRTEQVLQKLRGIAQALGPGSRLPSFRQLIRTCSVSQAIVSQALDQLEVEGIIERRSRSGVFVSSRLKIQPRLLLCDPRMLVTGSPFGSLLLNALASPFFETPQDLEIVFLAISMHSREETRFAHLIPDHIWTRLKAHRFRSVIAIGLDEILNQEIEAMGVKVISIGGYSHHEAIIATLEACQLGVKEIARRGARRIALFNTPFISMREVFTAAVDASGAEEILMPAEDPFLAQHHHHVVRSYRLIERGRAAAFSCLGPGVSGEKRPDGLISLDDTFTLGFLMGMTELGLRPIRDIQIASHTNAGSPIISGWESVIHRLEFDPGDMANTLHQAATNLENDQPLPIGWSPLLELPDGKFQYTYLIRTKLIPASAASD